MEESNTLIWLAYWMGSLLLLVAIARVEGDYSFFTKQIIKVWDWLDATPDRKFNVFVLGVVVLIAGTFIFLLNTLN